MVSDSANLLSHRGSNLQHRILRGFLTSGGSGSGGSANVVPRFSTTRSLHRSTDHCSLAESRGEREPSSAEPTLDLRLL